MRRPLTATLLACALACLAAPAVAAEADVMTFPPACRAKTAMPAAASGHAGHGMAMKAHQQAAMAGMAAMDRDMAAGMAQDDADIAFICGMIAHHQGAIAMSEVELKYGKDAFARQLAEKIIAAQKQEIRDMQDWVAKTANK